ncbi:hypothetical protein ACS0TY_010105 [Phlomoides rotata]
MKEEKRASWGQYRGSVDGRSIKGQKRCIRILQDFKNHFRREKTIKPVLEAYFALRRVGIAESMMLTVEFT